MDLSLSLFHITEERSHVIDLTFPVTIWYTRTIVRRGNPEVDPWGFLQPLGPFVWLAILISLLVVLAAMTLLPSCLTTSKLSGTTVEVNTENCVRVLLQQGNDTVIFYPRKNILSYTKSIFRYYICGCSPCPSYCKCVVHCEQMKEWTKCTNSNFGAHYLHFTCNYLFPDTSTNQCPLILPKHIIFLSHMSIMKH